MKQIEEEARGLVAQYFRELADVIGSEDTNAAETIRLNFERIIDQRLSELDASLAPVFLDAISAGLKDASELTKKNGWSALAQSPQTSLAYADDEIRDLVEDHWRALIPAVQIHGQTAFDQSTARLEKTIDHMASALAPDERRRFLEKVDNQRKMIADEYAADRIALKRRLGIVDVQESPMGVSYVGQTAGGLIIRTAIRATVWEGIFSLFRALR